jgi:hypothetical protein
MKEGPSCARINPFARPVRARSLETGMVSHLKRLAVDGAVDGAKSTIVQHRLAAVLDLE